jgi:hypothetical protein
MIPVGRVAKTYGGPDLMESGIREVNADWDNFRNWPIADIEMTSRNVRFRGKSGHHKSEPPCPLMTLIGNRLCVAAFETMFICGGEEFWSTGIRHRRLRRPRQRLGAKPRPGRRGRCANTSCLNQRPNRESDEPERSYYPRARVT